jgi:hypothetical protein
VTQHEDLELLRALAAPEQDDKSNKRQARTYTTDTAKNNLQRTGTPTLPRPQPRGPPALTPGADRVCASHALDNNERPLRFLIHDRDSKFSGGFDEIFPQRRNRDHPDAGTGAKRERARGAMLVERHQ